MSIAEVPAERRIGAAALARLLGSPPPAGPAYLALADGLRRCVLDGTLPLSTRLPSERELALALAVSRTTTAAAMERLREQGFVRTRRGSGSVTTLPDGPRPPSGAVLLGGTDTGATDQTADLTMAAPPAPRALHGAALRALDRLPRHLAGTGYAHLGLPELRALLAERYTRRGTPTSPDEILVTTGAQQAIALLTATLLGPGDRAVVEHPAYPHAISAVRATGARPVPVPVGPHGVDLDLLESTMRQVGPRLVHLTPDHHNPTGSSLDDAGRARVRALATRYRTVVVGDETLTDLTLDGPALTSFSGASPGRHVVALGSASKSFWGGLRVGWVRADRDLVTRLAQERVHHDMSTGVLDQLVTCELLLAADDVLAERRAQVRLQRDVLLAAVARHLPSWRVDRPDGGLSAWADLGAPVSSALAAIAPHHGVRIVPGPVFGVDGSFENRLRLPFSQPPDVLERGVVALAEAWRALGVPGSAANAEPTDLRGAMV